MALPFVTDISSWKRFTASGLGPPARLVPDSFRQFLTAQVRRVHLRKASRALLEGARYWGPDLALLEEMRMAWGAGTRREYVAEVAVRAASATGPILECGGGFTTMLLSIFAAARGVEVWSLEHSPEWHRRVSEDLRACRLSPVRHHLVELKDFGGYSWYDVPLARFPACFDLVVCDRTADGSGAGHAGLVPTLRDRLVTGSVILMNDADQADRANLARRWAEVERMELQVRGKYAVLKRR